MQMDLSIFVTSFLSLSIYLYLTSFCEGFEVALMTVIKKKNVSLLSLSLQILDMELFTTH